MVEPIGPAGPGGLLQTQGLQYSNEPHEVETLLAALQEVGRDLGTELEHHLQKRLYSLSRPARAKLVAVVDDVFEVTTDVTVARWQCHRLLASLRLMQAKDAVAEAELLLIALEHEPVANVLDFIDDTLERIDA